MINGEYIAPILTAFALVIGAVGVYLQTRVKNNETVADGWQGYAKKLESRIAELETQSKEDKKRITYLESELYKYQTMGGKIEEAKSVLHETVENKLEGIKKID